MKFTLNQNQLASLQEKNKLFNYLSASFTKTYFAIGDNKLVVFFKGAKGALKTEIAIEAPEAVHIFQIDYSKWTNALSKLSFSDEITCNLTEKFFRVSIAGNDDTITLGITTHAEGSSEAETVTSFIEAKKDIKHVLNVTPELGATIALANSMFATQGSNNAIAFTADGNIIYADRSIVFQAPIDLGGFVESTKPVELHRFSAGFILQAMRFGTRFEFNGGNDVIYWGSDDKSTTVTLASEPCEIAIPSPADIEMIKPKNGGSFMIDHRDLYNALDFFNGFYEASVWKPITFSLGAESKLHYKHPTTEVFKKLDIENASEGSFVVGSETLTKLLASSIDRMDNEECLVHFEYDEEAAGVHCRIGDLYNVIFAKLEGV